MKTIVIIKDYAGFVRQDLSPKISIDLNKVKAILKNNGFEIEEYQYDEIINKNVDIKGKYIIYSSSQKLEYKEYIDDLLLELAEENILIPKYEIFKAHENKGYQELLKKKKNISSLNAIYLATEKEFEKYSNKIKYPAVFKRLSGAGGINVFKVNNSKDVKKLLKKYNKPQNFLSFKFKKFLKSYIFRKYSEFKKESTYIGRYVLQEWVPNLEEDWKVLVFNEKYYVLNRKVKKNDFRASGSGKLGFIDPPEGLLDYSKEIYEKLDVPFVSLDICYDGEKFYLVEFQGTHFGPYTIVKSPYYFTMKNKKWEKIGGSSDLAEEYTNSIISYLNKTVN
ncbi:hypothetical protein CHL76_01200 [Marinococcus halophilus]|uniref:ATP-grasp domain-containing protein n=1 Tax=Marinococcus halophilus TaxID=1371 RepID=A0A510Y587_MARHA|nr:hypothetical protein [Marinococcus halophilus]OZT81739.1 hypothetical protein CHL76_01200 [Marinococcus halophilus]GEK57697.1 hypothetical protein MHA01_06020 [Marinococcus halophilus]